MMRWVSTSLPLSASSIRTPKMAPVEPVMPMMRRRIPLPPSWPDQWPCMTANARNPFGCKHISVVLPAWGEDRAKGLSRISATTRSGLEQVAELLPRHAALFRRGHVHLGEFVAPVPGPAGIDDRPAVGGVADRLALGFDARIERGRPGVADDVDRGGGVRAREHGPDQLFEIGHIDVVVDHDHVAAAIGADVAHGRDMAGLLGMAGIALVDGDGEQEPRVTDLVRPGRRHPRHARLLDILAQQRRADHGAIATNLVRRTLRHAAEQYRIVAIVDSLDVEHGFGPQVAGVIAGPFAERPFDTLVIRLDKTLEHDLGIGRDR